MSNLTHSKFIFHKIKANQFFVLIFSESFHKECIINNKMFKDVNGFIHSKLKKSRASYLIWSAFLFYLLLSRTLRVNTNNKVRRATIAFICTFHSFYYLNRLSEKTLCVIVIFYLLTYMFVIKPFKK